MIGAKVKFLFPAGVGQREVIDGKTKKNTGRENPELHYQRGRNVRETETVSGTA
ncbi:MAG: hypothetical protein K1W00_04990 [Lachnospiraceae bacterium]